MEEKRSLGKGELRKILFKGGTRKTGGGLLLHTAKGEEGNAMGVKMIKFCKGNVGRGRYTFPLDLVT